MTARRFFLRNLAATLIICVVASVIVYGFVLVFHIFASLMFIALVIGSGVHLFAIRRAKSKSERVFAGLVCAFGTSLLLTCAGGPGWNIVQSGVDRINLSGSLDWALLYAILISPAIFAAMAWINRGVHADDHSLELKNLDV